MATRFDGIDWGANGPKAITAVMYDLCNVKDADLMSPEKCLGTKIYESTFFYKIPWRNWRDIFDSSKTTKILMSLNDSIVLHTWGRFSSTIQTIDQHGMSAFSFIAKNNCPVSYPFIIEWKCIWNVLQPINDLYALVANFWANSEVSPKYYLRYNKCPKEGL